MHSGYIATSNPHRFFPIFDLVVEVFPDSLKEGKTQAIHQTLKARKIYEAHKNRIGNFYVRAGNDS